MARKPGWQELSEQSGVLSHQPLPKNPQLTVHYHLTTPLRDGAVGVEVGGKDGKRGEDSFIHSSNIYFLSAY